MQGGTSRSDGGDPGDSGWGSSGKGRRSTATELAGWDGAAAERVTAEVDRLEEDGVERGGANEEDGVDRGGTNRSDDGEVQRTSGLGDTGRNEADEEEDGTLSAEAAGSEWRRSTAGASAGWGGPEPDRGDDGETGKTSGLEGSGRGETVGEEDGTLPAEAPNEEETGTEEEAEVFITGEVHEGPEEASEGRPQWRPPTFPWGGPYRTEGASGRREDFGMTRSDTVPWAMLPQSVHTGDPFDFYANWLRFPPTRSEIERLTRWTNLRAGTGDEGRVEASEVRARLRRRREDLRERGLLGGGDRGRDGAGGVVRVPVPLRPGHLAQMHAATEREFLEGVPLEERDESMLEYVETGVQERWLNSPSTEPRDPAPRYGLETPRWRRRPLTDRRDGGSAERDRGLVNEDEPVGIFGRELNYNPWEEWGRVLDEHAAAMRETDGAFSEEQARLLEALGDEMGPWAATRRPHHVGRYRVREDGERVIVLLNSSVGEVLGNPGRGWLVDNDEDAEYGEDDGSIPADPVAVEFETAGVMGMEDYNWREEPGEDSKPAAREEPPGDAE